MAKKLDANMQGQSYLNSLLKDRPIIPLGQEKDLNEEVEEVQTRPASYEPVSVSEVKEVPVIVQERQEIPSTPVKEEVANPPHRLGRKRMGEKPKTRFCFSIDEDVLRNLRKIAYINHEPLSNILEDYVIRYVEVHKEDVEEFDRLPEKMKIRAGF